MKKRRGLGRGLGALIGEISEAYSNNLADDSKLVVELSVDIIKPNPLQPRRVFDPEALKELANSISQYGLLSPICVYEEDGEYFLIAGERRLRASKLIAKSSIQAVVLDKPEHLKEIALIENMQREDLSPLELAGAYEFLIKHSNLTHEELSKRLSKSRGHITNTLSLLKLPSEAKDALRSGLITQGHAKILVNLEEDECLEALANITSSSLSVRDSEYLVRELKEDRREKTNAPNEQDLDSKSWDGGMKVELSKDARGGSSLKSLSKDVGAAQEELGRDIAMLFDQLNFKVGVRLVKDKCILEFKSNQLDLFHSFLSECCQIFQNKGGK